MKKVAYVDVLPVTTVFKNQPAQIGNITIVHNVNLLKDHKAFMKCDFEHAVEIADASRGPTGFEYTLTHHRSYYFACSERGGLHYSMGMMKFTVRPMK
ncbi:hypothetical protein O6H91_09G104000 [Diphasiastrum complanatum]|uniref:Uncharacterized protein n=1 Tax=Diphasiastrum complanatum TaxID=34168 RepID=A0ACC2CSQ3_DIPCM|nr:hypothetical protein O6H91_Y371000 [Diphasiastrum complanatum]KAJ7545043.1 hypothetical protein O6H91_09G104000 [Diphasiastrum complanatum]